VRFWDASAIAPLLVGETSRDALLRLLEQDASMLGWWGTPVECASALARREREGALGLDDATAALERLRELATGWQEVLPSDAVRSIAQRLLRTHPLRAADSLQLAAAIVGAESEPATLEFVGLDNRLNEAAVREGFRILGGS
jgi:predicted nucleic acid-binding protein